MQNTSQTSITGKIWQMRRGTHSGLGLAQSLGVDEIIGRILASRGIEDGSTGVKKALKFMSPNLADMLDPLSLEDMEKAIERLKFAVKNSEKIAIFGDYDVDGSCASALLVRYFRMLGHDNIILYIPDRLSEGYGPNVTAIEKLAEQGVNLIVTVDCGSLAFEPFAKARDLGVDVIITDHHQTQPQKPECVALVNPNRVDESGELSMLSGAAVAFYMAMALNRSLREENFFTTNKPEPKLATLLDIVAVANICDMVPLTETNRILTEKGLQVLSQRRNLGLAALARVSGVDETSGLTTFDVGFLLGPRINAGGRISECDIGSRLISTEDEQEAAALALRLDNLNAERKEIEAKVQLEAMDRAESIVKNNPDISALVVAGEGWHPGVIGIVASRVKEKFHKPTFIIGIDENGKCKGSGRSIAGIDLGRAVIDMGDILIAGGGHAMAAGLTVMQENLPELQARLDAAVKKQAERLFKQEQRDVFIPSLKVDGVLSPAAANIHLMQNLERLAPYGQGNSEPRFVLSGIQVAYAKAVGADGSHIKVTFQGLCGNRVEGIAFKAMESDLGPFLLNAKGRGISVCGTLQPNTWQGQTRVQMLVKDAWDGNWNG